MNDFQHLESGSDHLDLILATSEIGIWELDTASGKAVRNQRHDQIFGHDEPLDEWSSEIFLSYVFKEDRDRVESLLNESIENGKPWSFETRIRRADGIDRWISAKGLPKLSPKGKVTKLIGHVIDITETKQNEDRLKLLTKELNHRVANTFTIMNSMVRQAAKKTNSVDVFAETLLERLGALSRANRVLIADEAERLSLQSILDMELKAFAAWRGHISIAGNTTVWFSAQASEALSLIFHELFTNAVKHGALSVSGGRVAVTVDTSPSRQVLIKWAETGGPAVVAEQPTGIGLTILQNAMRNEGSVKLDYAQDGLVCEIIVNVSFQREIPVTVAAPSTAMPEGQPINSEGSLANLRIMIVEDDPIIGMDIADILRSRGATVAGPFTTLADGLQALQDTPDAALLDVNLGQETTDAIALQLSDLSIPFLILSGQMDHSDFGEAFHGVPIVGKPFREQDLVARVIALVQQKGEMT